MSEPRVWTLRFEGRPWYENDNVANTAQRNRLRSEWHTATGYVLLDHRIPPLHAFTVTSRVHHKTKAAEPDVGAEYPSVKAIIDGIRMAGVTPDDAPRYMPDLHFTSPVQDGDPWLEVTVTEVLPD